MSQTIISVLVIVLGTILPKIGVTLGNDTLTGFASTLVVIGAAVWVWIRRVRAGGVTFAGVRK